jgi:type II secretory pathway pseudopilin PulG
VPEFSKARGDTMDGAREAAMHNVAKALESYYSRHGRYPTTGGQWSGDTSSYGGKGYGADGYIPGLVPEFIKSLPRDPDKNYPAAGKGYLYRSDGANYKFLAWNTPTVFSENHPLYDPVRPTSSWQISTFGAKNW